MLTFGLIVLGGLVIAIIAFAGFFAAKEAAPFVEIGETSYKNGPQGIGVYCEKTGQRVDGGPI